MKDVKNLHELIDHETDELPIIAQVQAYKNQIESLIAQGYSRRIIHEKLKKAGLNITYTYFTNCLRIFGLYKNPDKAKGLQQSRREKNVTPRTITTNVVQDVHNVNVGIQAPIVDELDQIADRAIKKRDQVTGDSIDEKLQKQLSSTQGTFVRNNQKED